MSRPEPAHSNRWDGTRRNGRLCLLLGLLAGLSLPAVARAPDPDSPRWKGVVALQTFLGSQGDEALHRFLDAKVAPVLIEELGRDEVLEELRRLRDDAAGLELQGASPQGPFSALTRFGSPSGDMEIILPFRLEPEPPHRFLSIGPIGGAEAELVREDAGPGPRAPLTWDGIEDRLEQEGFSGSVLVVRDGEIVLDEGYGMANREKGIPNRPDTIYAIGSTPIDFTKAGILLLEQEGKLSVSDPITRYFPKVPRAKRGITIEHLMTGQSGLRDFLGRPSDPNPDHFYIDRKEAMRRIFKDKLLFPPGEGRKHSHAAWGVLAAIIEIVSGQTYPEFTRERLLEPAGMKDTGFFGETYSEDRMAIGYGDMQSGEINAPPHWGPTSWLVMGSGGMYSTTGDMVRWHRAIAEGKILSPEYAERYWDPGSVLAGGDMFGFEIIYTQGPQTMMVLISNAGGGGGMRAIQALGRDLAELTLDPDPPKFSLGIEMDVGGSGHVTVIRVLGGSAAERDGLRAGDLLLAAGGRPLGDDPLAVLDPYLESGEAIPFELQREGKKLRVTVTPDPR